MKGFKTQTPSLYIQQEGSDLSTKVALNLTRAPHHCIVRLTGGCGGMSAKDATGIYDLFMGAFEGFRGAMIFGGTQMLRRDKPSEVIPGITEVAPLIREKNPESIILGIVPRTDDLKLSSHGLVVSEEKNDCDFFTIIHPNQNMCVVIQKSVDTGVLWEAEYLFAAQVVESLIQYCDWKHLLIAYNGGSITEKEILLWAQRRWPVLVIKDSGRVSDKIAADKEFLKQHPSVVVVPKNIDNIRAKMMELNVFTNAPLRLYDCTTRTMKKVG